MNTCKWEYKISGKVAGTCKKVIKQGYEYCYGHEMQKRKEQLNTNTLPPMILDDQIADYQHDNFT